MMKENYKKKKNYENTTINNEKNIKNSCKIF